MHGHSIPWVAGSRYGRLVVVGEGERGSQREAYLLCRCDCGAEKTARWSSLRSGAIQSCGCQRREALTRRNTTHGRANTSEYNTWREMHARCTRPKVKNYHRYGGRGITVCERWQSFEAFYADMGPRPSPQHSIDRIDNDGPYSPENCRWATSIEQGRNMRSNHLLTWDGTTMTLQAWADEVGITHSAILKRLKLGWSIEKVLSKPRTPGSPRG